MNKLQTKIMNMNFKKLAKRFIILSLIIVLLGGFLTGFMFSTQIHEVITYHQTYENYSENEKRNEKDVDFRYDEDNCKYREREHDYREFDFFESGQFTRPSLGAIIILFIYIVLCSLIALSYWLLVMSWIYQAASKADMNKTLWTIFAFFFNCLAVIAFLIKRSMQRACPRCGTYQKSGVFCRKCGSYLQIKCTECGELADEKDTYCSNCGKEIIHNSTNKTE